MANARSDFPNCFASRQKAGMKKFFKIVTIIELSKLILLLIFLILATIGWSYHGHNRPSELNIAVIVVISIYAALDALNFFLRKRKGSLTH